MMNTFQQLLPVLDSGLIFRARRAQLGLTLTDLHARSGVGVAALRTLELTSSVDLGQLRVIAPALKLSEEQVLVMLKTQRDSMLKQSIFRLEERPEA
jgi:transcriptional regulator with XRE-family HTH domain